MARSRALLFNGDKDTNFESNSQHYSVIVGVEIGCLTATKILILKAIHNFVFGEMLNWKLFNGDKDTNFESNSQQAALTLPKLSSCLTATKILILKAIHNTLW